MSEEGPARPLMAEKAKTKVRISVDLTESQNQTLTALEQKVGASSKADVFREALRLYEYFVEQVAAGNEVLLEKDGKQRHLVLFKLG